MPDVQKGKKARAKAAAKPTPGRKQQPAGARAKGPELPTGPTPKPSMNTAKSSAWCLREKSSPFPFQRSG